MSFSILSYTFTYSCLQVSRNFPITKYSTEILKKNIPNNRCHIIPFLHRKKNNNKSSAFQVHDIYSLAECLHCKKSIKFFFILSFILRTTFSTNFLHMTFVSENVQKPLLLAGTFPSCGPHPDLQIRVSD